MTQNLKSYVETSFGLVFSHGEIGFKYQHWYIKDSIRLVWPQAILVLALNQQQGSTFLLYVRASRFTTFGGLRTFYKTQYPHASSLWMMCKPLEITNSTHQVPYDLWKLSMLNNHLDGWPPKITALQKTHKSPHLQT
jgi:hypothetical protein